MKVSIIFGFVAVVIIVYACSDSRNKNRQQQEADRVRVNAQIDQANIQAEIIRKAKEDRLRAEAETRRKVEEAEAKKVEEAKKAKEAKRLAEMAKQKAEEEAIKKAEMAKKEIEFAKLQKAKILLIGVRGLGFGLVQNHLIRLKKLQQDSFLQTLINKGVYFEDGIEPVFPTTPVPNYYSMATGQNPGKHGVFADEFYDSNMDKYYGVDPFTYWYTRKDGQDFSEIKKENLKEVTDNKVGDKIFRGTPIWRTRKGTVACMYWPGCEFGNLGEKFVKFVDGPDGLSWEKRIAKVKEWLEDDAIKLVLMDYRDLIHVADDKGFGSIPGALKEFDDRIRKLASTLNLPGLESGSDKDKAADSNTKLYVNLIIVGSSGIHDTHARKPVMPSFSEYKGQNTLFTIRSMLPSMWLVEPMRGDWVKFIIEELPKFAPADSLPHIQVQKTSDIPHYNDNEKRIPPIAVFAKPGYTLSYKRGKSIRLTSDNIELAHLSYEKMLPQKYSDGHAVEEPSTWPAFIAYGPAFNEGWSHDKNAIGKMTTPSVHLLLCKLLYQTPDGDEYYNIHDTATVDSMLTVAHRESSGQFAK